MKHRAEVAIGAVVLASVAVFLFAPVVYSPVKVRSGTASDGIFYVSAYESPSCAIVGTGFSYEPPNLVFGNLSYFYGCPPALVVEK
jgi:hypothetical protein